MTPHDETTTPPSSAARGGAARGGAARDRATRTIGGVARLLAERPELRGVHAPADLADDALRWSA